MKRVLSICTALLALLLFLTACVSKTEQEAEPLKDEPMVINTVGETDQPASDEKAESENETGETAGEETEQTGGETAEEEEPEDAPTEGPSEQKREEDTLVEETETDPDAQWQITLDNTSFLQAGETLVKVYGIDETYAFVYTKTGDDAFGFQGRALLIDRQSGSVKQELYNVATAENNIPLGTLTPIRIGERILFGWQNVYTTGTKDHYYTIINGTVKKCASMVDDTYLGDGVFQMRVEENVNDIDQNTNPELFFQHFGWAYHTYWCFWSEDALDLREYKGIEITREELAKLEKEKPAVQAYIQKREKDGYVFDSMYLRGNGILNVNFYKQQEGYRDFACCTYLYSDGAFAPYPDAEYSSTGGNYEAACWPDEYCEAVVFPPLAALREN